MSSSSDVLIPLHNRLGEIVATAVVDQADAELATLKWYRLANGYAVRTAIVGGRRRMVYLHRAVLVLDLGARVFVDHIDGDRLNNRRSNLRAVTPAGNAQNRRVTERALPRNVYRKGSRFVAQVKLDRRARHLGCFDTVEEADRAARAWRAEHMPHSADARVLGVTS